MSVQGKAGWQSYPGTEDFLTTLQSLADPGKAQGDLSVAHDLFKLDQPLYVGRAPGRLDVMGGIADYSGSLVLQMPLAEACFVALQLDRQQPAPSVRVVSPGHGGHRSCLFALPTSALFPQGAPISYPDAVELFKSDPETSWAAYAVGCLLVLAREKGAQLHDCSVSILVSSNVPEGKGVSSSAALEVSVMVALAGALGLPLGGWELAVLCQTVENKVVGAPCGIMDQMACTLGEEGRMLALLCQPAEVQGSVPIPPHIKVWGIDSGVRHSVGGSDYGSVRVGAFMGLNIARQVWAQRAQQSSQPQATTSQQHAQGDGEVSGLLLPHLVHVSPSEYATWLSHVLPVSLLGSEFLSKYGEHLDSVTRVDPTQQYEVRAPTAHPIAEHHRVRLFRQLLLAPPSADQRAMLGELMFQSHASYTACKLGSPGNDRLVQMVRQHLIDASVSGTAPLLYGAKITGGGCGGTVCILGEASEAAEQAVMHMAEAYWVECRREGAPKVFSGSSGGAASMGCLTVMLGNK